MKLLITGGCGFLGSNLAAYYLGQGAEVVAVDALFRNGSELNLAWLRRKARPKQFSFFRLDLAKNADLEPVFTTHAPFDYICHCAGQVAMTTSLEQPRRDMQTNVTGTFNVLEAARRYSPGAFLAYSSTNKVYGDLGSIALRETATRYVADGYPRGFDESLPLDFASPYGCSKGAADQYVRDWQRNYGLKTAVFRHSSIYGGRQFATFDQGWIGWFCQKALEQQAASAAARPVEPFTIQGTGKQVRDVLHTDDLVRLYSMAYEHRDRIAGEIFNIGGGLGNSLSLLELFALLERQLRLPAPLAFTKLPRRRSDQDFFVADIAKAARLLSWQPRVDNLAGIESMLAWCRADAGAPDV